MASPGSRGQLGGRTLFLTPSSLAFGRRGRLFVFPFLELFQGRLPGRGLLGIFRHPAAELAEFAPRPVG